MKKNDHKFLKGVLIVIGLIVVAIAVFIATVKILNPSIDFKQLIPENVKQSVSSTIELIDNKFESKPINETTSSTVTTTQTTTEEMSEYFEFSEFKMKTSVQGNYLGNLLSKGCGRVGNDYNYIYYAVDGKGIYRMGVSSENYSKILTLDGKPRFINLRKDYIFFVNKDNGKLYVAKKTGGELTQIDVNVKFAYVYDNSLYYITNDNALYVTDISNISPKMMYHTNNQLEFVGVSLNNTFVKEYKQNDYEKYIVISNEDNNKCSQFRSEANSQEIKSLYMENGYIYYYKNQNEDSYSLIRQKFGSKKEVILVENCTVTDYPVINANRLYYATYKDSVYKVKELNMNSKKEILILKTDNVSENNSLSYQCGDSYNFLIGKKEKDNNYIYRASSIYTGSENYMQLKSGKWTY